MENHLNRIKVSQLRALVTVAESQNFSEAALLLEVSQSAVSHAIAALEDELGVQLLTRGRYGARLTPAGEQVTARARQVLQSLEEMVVAANLHKGLQGGRVRIASFRSVATHILPPVMAQFRETFPAIAVEIVEHEDRPQLEQALRDRKADIGFTYLPTDSDFESWELLRDEYVVLMPQQTNFGDRGLDWESLARYPLILPPPTDSCSIQVLQHLEANQQELNVAYRVREDSTIVRMVAQGLGVAILPQLAAEPIPPGVEMRSLPVRLERIIGVAIVADALQAPAVFAFLDTLKHWIAQPQATISGITPTPGLPREPSVR